MEKHIVIEKNKNENLTLIDINKDSAINIDVLENSILNLSIFSNSNLGSSIIRINVYNNSSIVGYFADFTFGDEKIVVEINLMEENSKCEWKLASLSKNKDYKCFDVSIHHLAKNTYAKMDNYGVCKDMAKLEFSGICSIKKFCNGSKTHQNSRIMVFDENANGLSKPILKIEENDVEASHAAVVGKISDEHLFYLTSRGLSEKDAKDLITLGYLKPILEGFTDDKILKEIDKCIQGGY